MGLVLLACVMQEAVAAPQRSTTARAAMDDLATSQPTAQQCLQTLQSRHAAELVEAGHERLREGERLVDRDAPLTATAAPRSALCEGR